MSFKFMGQPLLAGLYEPEGIYLHSPLTGPLAILQRWGEHAEFYRQFTYNGIPLKGHPGLDLAAPVGTPVLAVAPGRVVELSYERGGFGRYLKLEHSWGESLYAHLAEPLVESGQGVMRGALIAYSGDNDGALLPHLHLAVRIQPYNRFDGWGGFSDPLPFLNSQALAEPELADGAAEMQLIPAPLAVERPGIRRP
jgi:murein DD-endopeptidase MepM/ murein hydrolase activator NlpD